MARSPFRYFKTLVPDIDPGSPEFIQPAVMLYVRFPLSLRNVEDLLHERGIATTVVFCAEIDSLDRFPGASTSAAKA